MGSDDFYKKIKLRTEEYLALWDDQQASWQKLKNMEANYQQILRSCKDKEQVLRAAVGNKVHHVLCDDRMVRITQESVVVFNDLIR